MAMSAVRIVVVVAIFPALKATSKKKAREDVYEESSARDGEGVQPDEVHGVDDEVDTVVDDVERHPEEDDGRGVRPEVAHLSGPKHVPFVLHQSFGERISRARDEEGERVREHVHSIRNERYVEIRYLKAKEQLESGKIYRRIRIGLRR